MLKRRHVPALSDGAAAAAPWAGAASTKGAKLQSRTRRTIAGRPHAARGRPAEARFTAIKGRKHNRRDELAPKPIGLHAAAASGSSRDSIPWWVGRPQLVTAWSVIVLEQLLK